MQTTTLKITKLGGTPVFMAYSTDPRFAKVYGATRIPPKDLWYYPAFHPLYRFVLRDFHVLQVPLELSEAAQEAVQKLDRYAARIQNRELPEGFTFKTPPFQHQLEGLVHVLYNFRAALFYACGLGKGLPRQAPVLTRAGWKPISRLHVGEAVFGPDGRAYPVTGVFPQGKQHLNRVQFTDGTSVVCDDAHLWRVQNWSQQSRNGPWEVLSTKELRQKSLTYGSTGKSHTYRIPMTAPVEFPEQPVPLHPYLLGVLLGDGYLGQSPVSLTTPDDWIGEKISKVLPKGVHATRRVYCNKCPIWHFTANLRTAKGPKKPNRLTDTLERLGLLGKIAHQKHVPDIYLFNTVKVRLAVLQGLMDTDGSCSPVPEFSSASKTLAEAVVFLVESLGGMARIKSRISSYTLHGQKKQGKRNYRVTMTLPAGINPFSLPRKAERYHAPTRALDRRIRTIEDAGYGETVCIAVDSPDACFLTSDCVVTHNTKIVIDWQRALGATLLVLCPRVVVKVWPQEAARHGIDQEFAVIDATSRKGKLKQLEDAKNYPAVVISYDSMRRYPEELAALPYNAIVADESHFAKNPTSARTKVAIELSKKASRRIIMSGTPSTGNPLDMWSQFRFLSPCFLAEPFWKFKQDYCVTSKSNKHIVVGFKNLDVLNRRIEIVSLRKTKKECLDLPAQRIINLWLDLTTAQRRVYNTLVHTDEFEALHTAMVAGELFNRDGLIDVPNAAILVNKLIQVTCGFVYLKPNEPSPCHGCEHLRDCVTAGIKPHTASCKVDPVARPPVIERMASNAKLVVLLSKLTEILVEPTHKCIVWCQFGAEMDWVQEAIEAHWEKHRQDFTLVRVDGSTNKPDRLVDRFNQDPRCRVYLGQVETGVGITLNAANYMIYFSLPWKLLAYDQSLDRNHRLGQERDVTVFRLLARGTIDTHIARALSLKRTVSETLVATLRCGRCDRQKRCEDSGISLFEPGCKFQRRVARPVARPRSI